MSHPVPPGSRRRDATVIVLVLLLALAVRAWQPGHLGLGHYDEGVYAISASAVASWPAGDLFPGQTRFSPPVWFGTVGALVRVLDVAPHVVALSLNVLVGALTAAAAAAIVMAWFGTASGAAAGVLVALDPLGIMLSRSGLTDPTFALLFLLAVVALAPVLERGGWRPVVMAGLLTGLAWNTKYHGWFVLVVGVGALVLVALARRTAADRDRMLAAGRRLVGAGAVAALLYLPWALYMRGASGGRGLRGIVAYYLTLIGGDWFANAGRHLAMQGWLDGPLPHLAVPTALAAAVAIGGQRSDWRRVLLASVVLGIATVLGGALAAIVLLAAVGIAAAWQSRPWPAAALAAWIGLWLVAAPFYHPYARLLLPLMVALGLAAGIGVARVAGWLGTPVAGRVGMPTWGTVGLVVLLAGALAWQSRSGRGAADPWRDGRGSERAAAWLHRVVPPAMPIAVVGEPAVAYYLTRLGRLATPVVDELAAVDTAWSETWVAAGTYARRAPSIRQRIEGWESRRDSVAAFPLDPGDLRLLDDLAPARARAWRHRADAEFDLVLYRVEPAPGTTPGMQALRP